MKMSLPIIASLFGSFANSLVERSFRRPISARRTLRISAARTLYDKIWDAHVVDSAEKGQSIIYIDRHLVHEVTSPQAFEGMRLAKRKVHSPRSTLVTVDHNIPTTTRPSHVNVTSFIDDPD